MYQVLSFLAIPAFFFISCKEAPKTDGFTMTEEVVEEPVIAGDCYLVVSGQDSVLMQIVIENTSAAGQLHYRFFEKDKSGGTLFGAMLGDTLIADYKFISEGIESEREVAFLRRGNDFIEGYGESEERDGRMVFKNVAGLRFDGQPMKKIECDSLSRYFTK